MAAWNVKTAQIRGPGGARPSMPTGEVDFVEADELKVEAGTLVFFDGKSVKKAYSVGTWIGVERVQE